MCRRFHPAVAERPGGLFSRGPPAVEGSRWACCGCRGAVRDAKCQRVTTVFGVLAARIGRGCRSTQHRVQLPVWPNRSTGWVRAADVRPAHCPHPDRRRPIAATDHLAPGRQTHPRPIGSDRCSVDADSDQALYVTSASSPRIRSGTTDLERSRSRRSLRCSRGWPQGGRSAIHGTNVPRMIGLLVAHGCPRVRNVDALKFLALGRRRHARRDKAVGHLIAASNSLVIQWPGPKAHRPRAQNHGSRFVETLDGVNQSRRGSEGEARPARKTALRPQMVWVSTRGRIPSSVCERV